MATGGKDSQELAKDSEIHWLPLVGIPQNYQGNSHKIYAEDLVQTHAVSVLIALVSVNPYEPP